MNKFVELKDNGLIVWRGMCDNYSKARANHDAEAINMFEGFFTEKGISTVSQVFLDAIAGGKYLPNEGKDGVVVSYNDSNDLEEQWCVCDEPSEDVTFWDDGTHPLCSKHCYCYTCKKCNKIVQVG